MSIVMEILESMWNTRLHYKGVPVNLFGIPMLQNNGRVYTHKTFDRTIFRMKEKGYIKIIGDKWQLTEAGKEYFETNRRLGMKFHSPFPLKSPKNLLLMFDIPETKRDERNWLRWHLKEFQYLMLQQSVWVGPSPLPKKFLEHLKNFKLDNCIKTFKLAKPYKINN